jgi:hypothetical protein
MALKPYRLHIISPTNHIRSMYVPHLVPRGNFIRCMSTCFHYLWHQYVTSFLHLVLFAVGYEDKINFCIICILLWPAICFPLSMTKRVMLPIIVCLLWKIKMNNLIAQNKTSFHWRDWYFPFNIFMQCLIV